MLEILPRIHIKYEVDINCSLVAEHKLCTQKYWVQFLVSLGSASKYSYLKSWTVAVSPCKWSWTRGPVGLTWDKVISCVQLLTLRSLSQLQLSLLSLLWFFPINSLLLQSHRPSPCNEPTFLHYYPAMSCLNCPFFQSALVLALPLFISTTWSHAKLQITDSE